MGKRRNHPATVESISPPRHQAFRCSTGEHYTVACLPSLSSGNVRIHVALDLLTIMDSTRSDPPARVRQKHGGNSDPQARVRQKHGGNSIFFSPALEPPDDIPSLPKQKGRLSCASSEALRESIPGHHISFPFPPAHDVHTVVFNDCIPV